MRPDAAVHPPEHRSAVTGDVLLYAASAAFAAVTAVSSIHVPFRLWGAVALAPYAAATLVSGAMRRRHDRRPEGTLLAHRVAVALLVAVGATLAPLVTEVVLRHQRGPVYAQSEVLVTEEAAAALAHGRNPYSAVPPGEALADRPPAVRAHFPYLPLMAAFGMPRAAHASASWTDARVPFAVVTLALSVLALALWPAPPDRRLRAFQGLLVLPTGALFLTVGGDDLPVLALLLLALVLGQRGNPVLAGVAAGVAALLKFTAWPLMLLLPAAVTVGRRRACAASSAAVVLLGLPLVLWNPGAFLGDAVLFPLGLGHLRSVAGTPTLGSVVVGAFAAPSLLPQRALLTALLLTLAVVLASPSLRPSRVGSAADVAGAAGLVLALLFLLAPVGRLGYCIYPLNLLLWRRLLGDPDEPGTGAAAPCEVSAGTIWPWKPSGSSPS